MTAVNRYDLLVHLLQNRNLETCHVTYIFMYITVFFFHFQYLYWWFALYYLLNMFCQVDNYVLVPGNAVLSCYLLGSNFLFMNILCDFSRPTDDLSIFFKSFLLTRAFFACFLLTNRTIVVFEKCFDFPINWQASIFWLDKFTSVLSKILYLYL